MAKKEKKEKKEKKSKHSKKEKKKSSHRHKEKKASKEDSHSHSHSHHHHKKERHHSDEEDNRSEQSSSSSMSSNDNQQSLLTPNQNSNNITIDDYFTKSEEFRVWLKLSKRRSFEELNSSESHEYFEEFCTLWNSSSLPEMYYAGIPSEIRHECIRTKHKWAIRLSESEKDKISEVADAVELTTRKKFSNAWNHMATQPSPAPSQREERIIGPDPAPNETKKRSADPYEREEERERLNQTRKYEKHQEWNRLKTLADEIAPREKGKEAILDKKKEMGSRLRGAAQDREENQDGLNLSERDVMGGGDDFASVKARFERNKERREEKKIDRLRELSEKEQERQRNFLSQLNVDFSQGPIKIAPRNNS